MAEDHDFKTAYSHFYEAFKNFDANEDEVNARKALKYMCLAKVCFSNSKLQDNSYLKNFCTKLFQKKKIESPSRPLFLSFQIMLNEEAEVRLLLSSKQAVKYSGRDLDVMKDIAIAFEKRSLQNYYRVYIYNSHTHVVPNTWLTFLLSK